MLATDTKTPPTPSPSFLLCALQASDNESNLFLCERWAHLEQQAYNLDKRYQLYIPTAKAATVFVGDTQLFLQLQCAGECLWKRKGV